MGNTYNQPPETPFCDLKGPGQEGLAVIQLYLMPVIFICVLILGLPLNLLSLWIFSHRLKRWTRSTVLIFNLTLADASWLLALPFLIYFHLDRLDWTLGPDLCKAVRLLYHNYFYLSIFFVSSISLDRYLAIVHPLRSVALLGRRQTVLLCGAVWLVTLALSVPVAGMTIVQPCPGINRSVCTLYVLLDVTSVSLPYSVFCSITGFVFPLVSICYCCVRSVNELRHLPCLHRPHHKWRRLVRVMSAVLIIFSLLYLPYHLIRNATIVMRAVYPDTPAAWRTADLLFSLEMCVCSLNTCINPLFSCFAGQQFRRELHDTFQTLWRRRADVKSAAAPSLKSDRGAVTRSRSPGVSAVVPLEILSAR
ncbi:P2Y purinoceptor 3-like [Gadus macrocephalus]|uniref:P2Y purinoceptor 3-like n=1 Tax=Gadus macrocephalus TaxID=80720 RepID=UPI0028CB4FF9|nr:P2Y purinoceptor 3-like [Gadus macrocephalus]